MRRKEKEITDNGRIDEMIRGCDCCRLGFLDGDGVYIVPLNFGFAWEEGKRVLYFHGAPRGKKIDLAASGPRVGFEMDCGHRLVEGERACEYSFCYGSIIGSGTLRMVEDFDRKRAALNCIMAHYSGRDSWDFQEAAVRGTAVLRLEVDKLSCKASPAPCQPGSASCPSGSEPGSSHPVPRNA